MKRLHSHGNCMTAVSMGTGWVSEGRLPLYKHKALLCLGLGRYLPAAVLASLPGHLADLAVAIFPDEPSFSSVLSKQIPHCRHSNQVILAVSINFPSSVRVEGSLAAAHPVFTWPVRWDTLAVKSGSGEGGTPRGAAAVITEPSLVIWRSTSHNPVKIACAAGCISSLWW